MLTELSLLQGMDENDYGRYRDDVSDYYSDLNYYYNKYSDMSDREYQQYLNDLDSWESDRAYWYNKSQDEAAAKASAQKSSGSGGSKPVIDDDSGIETLTLTEANQALKRIWQEEGLTAAAEEIAELLPYISEENMTPAEIERALRQTLSMMGRK